MKLRDKLIVGILSLLLILLHRYLFQVKEGFFDNSSDYTKLKQRLLTDLGPYCKISEFVRNQLTTMVASSPDTSINKIYTDVYSCSDPDARSRLSCSPFGIGPNRRMIYVSCDAYTKLPDWSNDGRSTIALMKITSDLPERIVREAEWFSMIVKKLQDALETGANPPTVSPVGTTGSIEGFNGTCSADAARIQLDKQSTASAEEESKSCKIPSASSEIARVNALLDSSQLKQALSKMNGLLAAMVKLQSDLEKAKNGTLYEWQKDPPKKSYPQFKGGDRSASFMFSMQQNL
jgi:hypothetical protein